MNEAAAAADLRGSALSEAIALEMGWVHEWHDDARPNQCAGGKLYALPHWHDEQGVIKLKPPPFASSLDALEQVEARLIEAGVYLTVAQSPQGWAAIWNYWRDDNRLLAGAEGETEVLARARAVLLALRALKEGNGA